MAKKKRAQPLEGTDEPAGVKPVSTPQGTATESATEAAPTALASRKSSKTPKQAQSTPCSGPLNISRNKHWRFISSFHGPWLQLPTDLLLTIANINYNTPSPRPIDPAVVFDVYKIRHNVEEATNFAVRAASDTLQMPTNANRSFPSPSMNAFGPSGPGHGAKLSRERKVRMRELATQRLAHAYRLDEIVCSVATMQCSSPVADVAALVLQRSPQDADAKYVHFFHEKIPSRQVAESTSLSPLTDILSERPGELEALRTRATARMFKEDYDGAINDLTQALSGSRYLHGPHQPYQEGLQVQDSQRGKRREDVMLTEADQPSSLTGQLLFQRASVYLSVACHHIEDGVSSPVSENAQAHAKEAGKGVQVDTANAASADSDSELQKKQIESRKTVKSLAKRALRDYMDFISQFEYSPNLPTRIAKEFNDRMNFLVHGIRTPRTSDADSPVEPHTVYPLSSLFAAVPPPDIPPYPSQEVLRRGDSHLPSSDSCEWRTFHPLLAEALHSILLCHCLVQTSIKELQRHAYMVARLVRLSEGLPIFQASRSPARSDWVEVVRRTENWLQLNATWESLCVPAPAPIFDAHCEEDRYYPSPERAANAAAALINRTNAGAADEDRRKAAALEQAIQDSLVDDRVTDETSFRAAIKAREARAEVEYDQAANGSSSEPQTVAAPAIRSPLAEDVKDYPLLTERAAAIARWVQEAPVVTGTAKRKKRTKKPGKVGGVGEGVGKLELDEAGDAQG